MSSEACNPQSKVQRMTLMFQGVFEIRRTSTVWFIACTLKLNGSPIPTTGMYEACMLFAFQRVDAIYGMYIEVQRLTFAHKEEFKDYYVLVFIACL